MIDTFTGTRSSTMFDSEYKEVDFVVPKIKDNIILYL